MRKYEVNCTRTALINLALDGEMWTSNNTLNVMGETGLAYVTSLIDTEAI